jgi:hypothetical protein
MKTIYITTWSAPTFSEIQKFFSLHKISHYYIGMVRECEVTKFQHTTFHTEVSMPEEYVLLFALSFAFKECGCTSG